MKRIIYADNAATTKLDIDAFEAMRPYLLCEYGNASQPYSFSRLPKKALQEARKTIAACINAEPDEIYFTSGGTESDNWAIKGFAPSDIEKKVTITSTIEHHAVLHACSSIESMGHQVAYLNPDKDGTIRPETLESIISNNTRLVSVMYSNNEIGTVEPITKLAAIAHSHGAIFHTDAVQAVGHVPIDVKSLRVDMLSASAHKFNGPKGIGLLYIRHGIPLKPLHDGGAQELGMRAGTENIASIVGMAKALENNCKNIENQQAHIRNVELALLDSLNNSGLDFIRNGSDDRIPGNISLSFYGTDGEAMLHRLDLMGVCVSTGSACDGVKAQISHVLRAIQLEEIYAKGTIRISLGKDNTVEEAKYIADSIITILRK